MRQFTITDARREAAKAKIALSGGPGWGKTWTALRVARVLSPTGTLMAIDTEHESAKLYAPPFEFKHLNWEPPYDPRELTEAIHTYAPRVDVLIVDSLSHFWQGEGGTLDIASGKFTGWKDARPIQRALVDAVVRAPCHLIGCMRSKVEYAQEVNPKTQRQEVKRLGQADIQDNEIPYEFTIAAELDAQHQLTITKTRCHDLALGKVFPPNREVDMAATLLAWLDNAPPAEQAGEGAEGAEEAGRAPVTAPGARSAASRGRGSGDRRSPVPTSIDEIRTREEAAAYALAQTPDWRERLGAWGREEGIADLKAATLEQILGLMRRTEASIAAEEQEAAAAQGQAEQPTLAEGGDAA